MWISACAWNMYHTAVVQRVRTSVRTWNPVVSITLTSSRLVVEQNPLSSIDTYGGSGYESQSTLPIQIFVLSKARFDMKTWPKVHTVAYSVNENTLPTFLKKLNVALFYLSICTSSIQRHVTSTFFSRTKKNLSVIQPNIFYFFASIIS